MKPTLVSDCDHYNWDTNKCNKCNRMMPEVCVDFEDMQRKAKAYDEQKKEPDAELHNGTTRSADDAADDTMASVDTPAVPKPRGRQKRVAQ